MSGVSKACKSGACQTCTYTAAQCECSHHLHGSVLTAEPVGFFGAAPVPVADCLDAEATIQRLIAQQDASAKTIEALAKLAWESTSWTGRRHEVRALLESLGFGERMREWAA